VRTFTVAIEPANQPEVIELIEALDAYQSGLYPAESNHFIDIAALSRPEVIFAVARDASGPVGCGAIVIEAQWGELKRMFVHPSARGMKVGAALLEFLEAQAAARGCGQLMLETGVSQPEALGLYQRAGWKLRGPFGTYTKDPLSIFMEKDLRTSSRRAQ
jgi:putative acetyltransferase